MSEIVVRSSCIAGGYNKNPGETARAFAGAWYRSGDIGSRDAQSWVFIRDREKDLIISGGFDVYPSEVESVLLSHDAVHDCAVIGVPHEHWGEAVMAIVELKPATTLSEPDLLACARE